MSLLRSLQVSPTLFNSAVWHILLTVLLLSLLASERATAEELTRGSVLSFDTSKIIDTLEDALIIHNELPTLEASRLIGRDKELAQRELDDLVEKAILLFQSGIIIDLRKQYRRLEVELREENKTLSEYRTKRVLASKENKSLRVKLAPGETLKSIVAVTKGDFDALIKVAKNNIASYEDEIAHTTTTMSQAMGAIGVRLDNEQLEALMSSVTGDDMVRMSVIFNAIKDMTTQFEELTRQSGESLTYAKKYYGMVIILHRITNNLQLKFIADIDQHYLPKLQEYRDNAQSILKDSNSLIAEGGNKKALNNNIRSNELTIEVIDLYTALLKKQRDQAAEANRVTAQEIKVADNTYRTVSLSSAVVSMIREGIHTFDQLISLQMPDIQEFQNDTVRQEFRKLTDRLVL